MYKYIRDYLRLIPLISILGFAGVALIWNITVEPLDHGYPRYVAIADTMVRTGEWIVPRLAERVYLQKPPLFIWLIALTLVITGDVPEWAGHFPNVLAAIGTIIMVYFFSLKIFASKGCALLSIFILCTSYGFAMHMRDERLDMLFTAFIAGTFIYFYYAITNVASRPLGIVQKNACYIFLGLATLTKGPVALLFFLAVTLLYTIWSGRSRFFLEKESFYGYGIFLIILSIWPLLLIEKIGFKETLAILQTTEMMTRREGPFYYLLRLPITFSPWSIFLPGVIVWLVWKKPYKTLEGIRLLVCWIIIIFVLLHLSSCKNTRYFLPAIPPLAVLVAGFIYNRLSSEISSFTKWICRIKNGTVWMLLSLLLAVNLLTPLLLLTYPEDNFLIIGGSIIAGCGSLIGIRQFLKYRDPTKTTFFICMLIILLYGIYDLVEAKRFIRNDTRKLAEHALAPVRAGLPAITYRLKNTQRQFLVSMIVRREVPAISTISELKSWIKSIDKKNSIIVVGDASDIQEVIYDTELSAKLYADFCLERRPMKVVQIFKWYGSVYK